MQINPTQITKYDRSEGELQAFWIFCIMVAGKNSDYAARVVSKLLSQNKDQNPFAYMRRLSPQGLHNALVASKCGQYHRIHRAISESLELDLRTCTLEDLMGVYGVGPKTARFFLLHTRRECECAVLDTHILSWLRNHGVEDAPKSTPQKKEIYHRFEQTFLNLIPVYYPNCSVAEADLLIWTERSGRLNDDSFAPELPSEIA